MKHKLYNRVTKRRSVSNRKRKSYNKKSVTRKRQYSKRVRTRSRTRKNVSRKRYTSKYKKFGGMYMSEVLQMFTDYLEQPGIINKINYRESGVANNYKQIVDSIKRGLIVDFNKYDISDVTSALKLFLRENKLISNDETMTMIKLYKDFSNSPKSMMSDNLKSLLNKISTLKNIDVLYNLLTHLHKVWRSQGSRDDKTSITTPGNIAIVFAPTLFQISDMMEELQNSDARIKLFEFIFKYYDQIPEYRDQIIQPRLSKLSPIGRRMDNMMVGMKNMKYSDEDYDVSQ